MMLAIAYNTKVISTIDLSLTLIVARLHPKDGLTLWNIMIKKVGECNAKMPDTAKNSPKSRIQS